MNRRARILLVGAILVVAIAVLLSYNAHGVPRPATSCAPGTPQPGITALADCVWAATAYAWLDEDADGAQDAQEPPLTGIPFFVDDVRNHHVKVGHLYRGALTNMQGQAQLDVFYAGCPEVAFEIYPEVPAGYRLTTAPRLAEDHRESRTFPFGFAYLPGVPTATPRPSSTLGCTSYPLTGEEQYYSGEPLVVAPDGKVWIQTYESITRLDPAAGVWDIDTEQAGVANWFTEILDVAPDGMLWFVAGTGMDRYAVVSYDGVRSSTYSLEDGLLLAHRPIDLIVGPDGRIWLMAREGASVLTPESGQIVNYPLEPPEHDYYFMAATVAPDNSLWAGSYDFVVHLIPTGASSPVSMTYTVPAEMNDYRTFGIEALAGAKDGTLWLAGQAGVLHFNPATEHWTQYSRRTTNNAMLGEGLTSFALAPDGSLWLGTYENGVLQIIPAADDDPAHARVIYHTDSLLTTKGISSIGVGLDGTLWFGTERAVIHCANSAP